MKIAVVGGGISGIRAALTLGRAGHAVTLFEKQKFLGGRVFSFAAPEFGEVDIGQHVWLKCCTALEGLIRDLAIPDTLVHRQPAFSITYMRPGRDDYQLRSSHLPGLLHLLPGLLHFPVLTTGETFALLRGMARAKFTGDAALEKLDAIPFARWLEQHGQPAAAVAALWEPLVLSVCNQRVAEVSARHALFTFRNSLLHSKHAADICFFRAPLSEIFDRRARAALTAAGVDVMTGAPVRKVAPGAAVELRCGETDAPLRFDRAVVSPPAAELKSLLPDTATPPDPGRAAIAGLLLKYPKPVMDGLFFAALDSPIQWVFNKSAVQQRTEADGGQTIEILISGAERECAMGGEAVERELLPALAELLPETRGLKPQAVRFISHAAATFAMPPGAEKNRRAPADPLAENVFLAGDHAATGWPSTMESAVRAGESAAMAVLRSMKV